MIDRAAVELRNAIFLAEEHPELETELFSYADGTLTGKRRAAVEEHLTHCRICRQDVADAHRARQAMTRPAAAWPWWMAAAAAVVIAVFASVTWTRLHHVIPEPVLAIPIRSVAVLPLHNNSSVQTDDFLTVALADALTMQLRDVPALHVRPMSAVLASHDVASLAVDSIIEGRFVVSGNLVEITLSLIDSRTGRSLWAGSTTGPRDNLMNLVESISSRTLTGLNEKLGVQRTGHASMPRSLQPAAYEEYLKARAVHRSFIPERHEEEIAHLKRAVALDPQFAAAYADLGDAIALGGTRGLTDGSNQIAERYAREAIRLDPELPESHLALGRALYETNIRESMKEYAAALKLNARDASTMGILTSYFASIGDAQRVGCLLQQLPEIDPTAQEYRIRGYWYLHVLDAKSALRAAADALATKDTELAGCDIAAHANVQLGNYDEAEKYAVRASTIMPSTYILPSIRAMSAAARGDRPAALKHLQEFSELASRNRWAALDTALIHARLGDRAEAAQWIKRTGDLHSHTWYGLKNHPWTQLVQDDPQVQATLQRMRGDLDFVRDDMLGVYETICGPQWTDARQTK